MSNNKRTEKIIKSEIGPLVSIIVPVYNSEKVILRCLKSISNQQYKNIEIICVDDGSKDNSIEIIKSFKLKTNTNVTIISQTNSGVSVARNVGIKKSKGDYITFVDADDYIEHQMINKLVEQSILHSADIVKCSRYDVYDNKKIARKPIWNKKMIIDKASFKEKIYPQFYGRCRLVNVFATLISSKLIKSNHIYFNEKMTISEDEAFSLELFDKSSIFVYIPKPLYNYVKGSGGLSANGVKLEDRIRSRSKSIDIIKDYSDKWKLPNRAELMMEKIAYLGIYTAMQTSYKNENYTIKQQKQLFKSIIRDERYREAIERSKKKAMIKPEKIICTLVKMHLIDISFYISRAIGFVSRNFRAKLEKYRNA